jgi:hypothetical protein
MQQWESGTPKRQDAKAFTTSLQVNMPLQRWGNPANGPHTAVPRYVEIPAPLAKKTCRDLGVPEPSDFLPKLLCLTFGLGGFQMTGLPPQFRESLPLERFRIRGRHERR